eukprot:CAMPEP_0185209992 /NCGR_PEP_ID=MMETSP1140-20130426/64764_1 /TAXON_ID=298111 /ORGANISM="Pavlova sp., Strain CCMP459" /LENGTH=122 /DNA_ID=CAMNT_0027777777 /DNA_START=52 /DNA_END=420 /DNA_ORIENTATION=+
MDALRAAHPSECESDVAASGQRSRTSVALALLNKYLTVLVQEHCLGPGGRHGGQLRYLALTLDERPPWAGACGVKDTWVKTRGCVSRQHSKNTRGAWEPHLRGWKSFTSMTRSGWYARFTLR